MPWLQPNEMNEVKRMFIKEKELHVKIPSISDKYLFEQFFIPFLWQYAIKIPDWFITWESEKENTLGLFIAFIKRDPESVALPNPSSDDPFDSISLGELAKTDIKYKNFISEWKDISSITDFIRIINKIIPNIFEFLIGSFSANPTDLIKYFIINSHSEIIHKYIVENRQANNLREQIRVRLSSFLNTFDKDVYSVHNRTQLNIYLNKLLKEDYPDLIYGTSGKQVISKLLLDESDVLMADNKFIVNITKSYNARYRKYISGDLLSARETGETASEYEKRILEKSKMEIDNSLNKLVNHLRNLTSNLIFDDWVRLSVKNEIRYKYSTLDPEDYRDGVENLLYWRQRIRGGDSWEPEEVPWKCFKRSDVKFEFFHVQKSKNSINILIKDNFLHIMENAPDLVRTLMNTAELQPLTKSSKKIEEYDGGGELDIDATINFILNAGEIKVMQQSVDKFKERDKARFCFILDTSNSMAETQTRCCAVCGAVEAIRCEHVVADSSNLIEAPSFRYAQFLLTIMILIFKDFMKDAIIGFLDYNFEQQNAFKEFEGDDWEKIIWYIWNVSYPYGDKQKSWARQFTDDVTVNPYTNYYTLGRLYSDYQSFFDGYNTKFVFLITDAEVSDIFNEIFRIKRELGKDGASKKQVIEHVYTNGFPFLKKLTRERYVKFIQVMITNPKKWVIFTDKATNPFTDNLTKIRLLLFLRLRIEYAMIDDLKKFLKQQDENETHNKFMEEMLDEHGTVVISELLSKDRALKERIDTIVLERNINSGKMVKALVRRPFKITDQNKLRVIDDDRFWVVMKELLNYDYDLKPPIEVNRKETRSEILIEKVLLHYPERFHPEQYTTDDSRVFFGTNEKEKIMYMIFLLETWDRNQFVTDYSKLPSSGELQRWVNYIKEQNLTNLRSKL